GPQATLSSTPRKASPSVIEKPYVIHLKDIPHQTIPRAEVQGDD
ncbi:unnamed protein product, partial [Rotaria sp. Silwood2]